MAVGTTKAFPKHLDGDIHKIWFENYRDAPVEFDKCAHQMSAPPGGRYTEAQLSGLGPLRTKPEGSQIYFDNPVEGNEKDRTYTTYALGFQITPEMLQDDRFANFKKMPKELARSAAIKRETVFWDLFNNGFATHLAWDGQYIFDASGRSLLKDGGAQNNRPSADGSLSETTLQAALEYFYDAKDQSGKPVYLQPEKLVVPTELMWTASVLLKTPLKPGSADNDINTIKDYSSSYSGLSAHVSRFLTSTTAWFVLAKEHDFKFVWKTKAKMDSSDDFSTGSRLYKATMRFSTFCNDPVGCYGTTGA